MHIYMDAPNSIFWSCFVFGFVSFLWEFYLSLRQYRKHCDTKDRPDNLHGIIDEASFKKARLYHLDNARFGFAKKIWVAFENTIMLLFNMIFVLWNFSGQILFSWGYSNEILQSLLFLTLVSLLDYVINVPWTMYKTFVVEEKHGFNKQTLGFFVKDQIKTVSLTIILGLPISASLIWIIQKGGDYFVLFVWVFLLLLTFLIALGLEKFSKKIFPFNGGSSSPFISILFAPSIRISSKFRIYKTFNMQEYQFLMTIYPEFIAPLFDKYTSLQEGELRTKIEALATRLNFPLKKLYVVDGSKRSAHSNAYFYGFWNNKRIVLFDTLIANYAKLKKNESNEISGIPPKNDQEDTNGDWEKPDLTEEPAEPIETVAEENVRSSEDETKKIEATDSVEPRKNLGMSNDEIVAVLGHELGHWKLKHTLWNLVVFELNTLLCLTGFSVLYKWPALYAAFGFTNSQPTLIGLLIIFSFVFSPYNEIVSFLTTCWSRKCEFAADNFSAGLGYADLLRSALVKLGKDNLSFPVNDRLYSAWHHSHPPTPERIEALRKFD